MIYINSIQKSVTEEEFENFLPKIGDTLLVNKRNIMRRIEDPLEVGPLRFECIAAIEKTELASKSKIINVPQLTYTNYHFIASLDIVDKVACGEWKILDGKVFDSIYASVCKSIDVIQNQIEIL